MRTRSRMMVPMPAPTGSENTVNAAVENTIWSSPSPNAYFARAYAANPCKRASQ